MPKSHYDTIGANPDASAAQLRRAYLQRARRLHPDQFAGRPARERASAERRMQELNAAWSVLSDPESRRAYDAELARRAPSRATGPIVSGRGERWQPFEPDRRHTPTPEPGPVVADERAMEIRGAARLLRPLPLLTIFAVVAGLILAASLLTGAGDGTSSRRAPTAEPTGIPIGCISLVPIVEEVPCGSHDAVVWSVVEAGEPCESGLEAVYRQGVGGLFCVTRTR